MLSYLTYPLPQIQESASLTERSCRQSMDTRDRTMASQGSHLSHWLAAGCMPSACPSVMPWEALTVTLPRKPCRVHLDQCEEVEEFDSGIDRVCICGGPCDASSRGVTRVVLCSGAPWGMSTGVCTSMVLSDVKKPARHETKRAMENLEPNASRGMADGDVPGSSFRCSVRVG